MSSAVHSTLDSSYDTTSLDVAYVASPSTDGNEETDLMFQYQELEGDVIGQMACDDPIGSSMTKCDQAVISFDGAQLCPPGGGAFCAPLPLWALACHEIGHAVGLTHGVDADPAVSDTDANLGCLVTPLNPYSPVYALGSQNTALINATYCVSCLEY